MYSVHKPRRSSKEEHRILWIVMLNLIEVAASSCLLATIDALLLLHVLYNTACIKGRSSHSKTFYGLTRRALKYDFYGVWGCNSCHPSASATGHRAPASSPSLSVAAILCKLVPSSSEALPARHRLAATRPAACHRECTRV